MRILILPLLLALVLLPSACSGSRGAEPDLSGAVGWLLRDGEAGPCQAVVIAPDRILTAAHCVVETGPWRPLAPREVQFLTPGHAFEVLEVVLPPGRALDPSGAILDLQQDWAILRIATARGALPAPVAVGGLRAARLAFTFGQSVIKAGVVRSEDGRETVERFPGCTIGILDPHRRLLTYSCAGGTGPGLSGSPLLVETGRGYEVIGVMSARERLPSGNQVGIVVIPPVEEVEGASDPP